MTCNCNNNDGGCCTDDLLTQFKNDLDEYEDGDPRSAIENIQTRTGRDGSSTLIRVEFHENYYFGRSRLEHLLKRGWAIVGYLRIRAGDQNVFKLRKFECETREVERTVTETETVVSLEC